MLFREYSTLRYKGKDKLLNSGGYSELLYLPIQKPRASLEESNVETHLIAGTSQEGIALAYLETEGSEVNTTNGKSAAKSLSL